MNIDWMNEIGELLGQYSGKTDQQTPDTVYDDFDQFAQKAPRPALAGGLAEAFRSDQTPPFGQMLGQLFGQSSGSQRAGILNALIGALGPSVMAQLASQRGASSLAGLLGGGTREITPQQAEQISPEAVQDLATEAEKKDQSIIDRLSDIYAEHPTLIKSLGSAALAVALAKIAQQFNRG